MAERDTSTDQDSGSVDADQAQEAFYTAFGAADLQAMMAVWADDQSGVECIHPMSSRLTTRAEIEASWRNIFGGANRLQFSINDVGRIDAGDLCVRIVHEDISFGPRPEQQSRVIATNIYRRTPAGWFMVLHHGSPGLTPEPTETPHGRLH